MTQSKKPQQDPSSSPLEKQRKKDVDTLARTLYGEARGESLSGKEAVACVILNRVKRGQSQGNFWWGNTVQSVCQKPWQFSCWNENDPNRDKIMEISSGHRVFDTCLRIARRAISGCLDDATNGATHYHTKNVNPPWSRGRAASAEIGHHLFYNDIE